MVPSPAVGLSGTPAWEKKTACLTAAVLLLLPVRVFVVIGGPTSDFLRFPRMFLYLIP